MADSSWRQRLMRADRDVAEAKQKVDAQLAVIYRLEALGRDDVMAQQKLEVLLETLEEAQQRRKILQNTIR